jgi:hypothetical protein
MPQILHHDPFKLKVGMTLYGPKTVKPTGPDAQGNHVMLKNIPIGMFAYRIVEITQKLTVAGMSVGTQAKRSFRYKLVLVMPGGEIGTSEIAADHQSLLFTSQEKLANYIKKQADVILAVNKAHNDRHSDVIDLYVE